MFAVFGNSLAIDLHLFVTIVHCLVIFVYIYIYMSREEAISQNPNRNHHTCYLYVFI